MTQPLYAIGDIHGQLAEMRRVLDLIEADGGPDARIVFLGDYIDRGSDSKGVIDLLVEGLAQGRPWTCLKGNHDRMMEWFLKDYPIHEAYLPSELYWLHPRLGGDTTLASYGVEVTPKRRKIHIHAEAQEAVPQAHRAFLENCLLSYETESLFLAHAGIRPEVPLADQSEHDLLWIREEFHRYGGPHPKLIVHGHTPVDEATHFGNRIDLDSGAGHGHPLTGAVFEGHDCWVLTEKGRVPLKP
ncbi:MAG: metallophosphoesterase family protein [Sulfitobacter sp.]|nr:metallophosphoesterase family protein [Sulfitobacter sp.]